MSDLVGALRAVRPGTEHSSLWWEDAENLISRAADRIVALEAEVKRLREVEEAAHHYLRLETVSETADPGVGIDRFYARERLVAAIRATLEGEKT